LAELRVDGGAAVMDLLLQVQADQTGVPVARPTSTETTAIGAAALAGLAEGVWASPADVGGLWQPAAVATPVAGRAEADTAHARWLAAVERARHWAAGPTA
jgi:glycerol kinase